MGASNLGLGSSAVLLAVMIATAGCNEPSPPTPVAEKSTPAEPPVRVGEGACPPRAVVEQLHAAADHFEQGEAALGRAALDAAERDMPTVVERDTVVLWSMFSEVKSSPDGGAPQKLAAEAVRAKLHDWACLTEPIHTAVHEAEPPAK